MQTFIIDVPVPSMGATVSELNVIVVKVKAGDRVTKGQRLADLESDKSAFEFESPCDGTVTAVMGKPGAAMNSGDTFLQLETGDESMRHLESKTATPSAATAATPAGGNLVWTPRAIKLAQEAGLDYTTLTGVTATGPGNRVTGDDVQRYLANRQG